MQAQIQVCQSLWFIRCFYNPCPIDRFYLIYITNKFKEQGVIHRTYTATAKSRWRAVTGAADEDIVGFFLPLSAPTSLDPSNPAQNTPGKPKWAARERHAPPPNWRVGVVLGTVAILVSRSMWRWRWISGGEPGRQISVVVEMSVAIYLCFWVNGGGGPPISTKINPGGRGAKLCARVPWQPSWV